MVNERKAAARTANLAETLARVRSLAAQAQVQFSGSVLPVMSERALSVHDVMHALAHAIECHSGEEDVHVTGPDIDGDEIRLRVRVTASAMYVISISHRTTHP